MKFVFDPITIINLFFCLGVVVLSIWWHRESKSRTPLYIGVAFAMFGLSHAAFLLDLKTSIEGLLIIDRIAAYVLVFVGLFFIARDALRRQKAEEEALTRTEELHAAYQEITATAEELKENYDELRMSQNALELAHRKLNLLNSVTFTDIQNAVFSLSGYLELEEMQGKENDNTQYLEKEISLVKNIEESLKFAKQYQDLGIKAPSWQNVERAFLMGISHLNLSGMNRNLDVEGLEIFADPMLENVFFALAENVITHGEGATEISLSYSEEPEGLVLVFKDNGSGISREMKEKIFDKRYEKTRGMGLFISRESLSVTGITITETGREGEGARFEMKVPLNGYRLV